MFVRRWWFNSRRGHAVDVLDGPERGGRLRLLPTTTRREERDEKILATVTTYDPFADVRLADGDNTVVVAINKKTADSYAFAVRAQMSVNGVPLTQLSATRPHTPVFLSPGLNVISAANGTLSIDYYLRDGGDGMCTLP